VKTAFVPSDDSFPPDQAKALVLLLARQDTLDHQFLYQLSPNLVDAATLRGFTGNITGSIVPTFDTQDANLGGSAQVVLSHGERDNLVFGGNSRRSVHGRSLCNDTTLAPIQLFSGMGNNVTIIKEDIPFDGGLLQITNG
jgi:hypothetical protein